MLGGSSIAFLKWKTNVIIKNIIIIFFIIVCINIFQIKPCYGTTKEIFHANSGINLNKTFWGHYGGELDNTASSYADGGNITYYINNNFIPANQVEKKYICYYFCAENRYIDSGTIFKFDSSYQVTFITNGWAGDFELLVADNDMKWQSVGIINTHYPTEHTFDGDKLPIKNVRYFRARSINGGSVSPLDIFNVKIKKKDLNDPNSGMVQIFDAFSGVDVKDAFYGHFRGDLDNTISAYVDGGYTTFEKGFIASDNLYLKSDNIYYYNAQNRCIDSGRIFEFDSLDSIKFSLDAHPGKYELYVGDNDMNWHYVDTVEADSNHKATYSIDGSKVPIKDVRYFRAFSPKGGNVASLDIFDVEIDRSDDVQPNISLSQNTVEWTNKNVTIQAIATDNETGITKLTLPNNNSTQQSIAIYEVTQNGIYTFEAEDEFGNKKTESINITNIDKINPEINLELNNTITPNETILVKVNAKDNESGIKAIELPNGKIELADNITYEINVNGKYIFKAIDKAGNEIVKSIDVIDIPPVNVDTTSPEIKVSTSTTDWTNKKVIINVEAIDIESGVDTITKPDGSIINQSIASYEVDKNGVYTFEAKDKKGNVSKRDVVISNIDNIKPKLKIQADTSGVLIGSVKINIEAEDAESKIQSIKLPDGKIILGSKTFYEVSQNGTYYFMAKDNADNEIIESIDIINILPPVNVDTTPPEIKVSTSTTDWTNKKVIINVEAIDIESGVDTITKPDGSIINQSTASYEVDKNGVYTFEAKDKKGNVSKRDVVISNIDNIKPKLKIQADTSGVLTGSVKINIEAEDAESKIQSIKLPDGKIILGSKTVYEVSQNGTYYFMAKDNAGNEIIDFIVINYIQSGIVVPLVNVVTPSINVETTQPEMKVRASVADCTNKKVTINVEHKNAEILITKASKNDEKKEYQQNTNNKDVEKKVLKTEEKGKEKSKDTRYYIDILFNIIVMMIVMIIILLIIWRRQKAKNEALKTLKL